MVFNRKKGSKILGKAHFLSMYDKVSEHRGLFLLVTQVGYTRIVKKTEIFFYLIYKRLSLSLSPLSLGKPSLSAFCLRHEKDDNGNRFLW